MKTAGQSAMPASSTTRWRDEPVVPKDYDDLAALVKAAREARGRIVEFDWVFTRDDLERLRRAVKEWGSTSVGRYKGFDSRVLAAINDALGEKNSMLVLKVPSRGGNTDCEVTCVSDGQLLRLQGHAPFDIVFGYGSVGVSQDPMRGNMLGPMVQKTLSDTVGMLGWDLRRLQDERFRPVRNAIYGLALNYSGQKVTPASGPAVDVEVHFHGPFSSFDDGECRCLFNDEIAKRNGIYLWTINVGGRDCPWYVGQSRRGFGQRMGEHLRAFLSGEYTTHDAAALSIGKHQRASGAVEGKWPQTIPSILRNYETLAPSIIALTRLIRFHVAPLAGDAHLHDRVEGSVGRHYKRHADPGLREFIMPGLKLPAAIPGDSPVRLVLSSDVPIAGLPPFLAA